MSASEKLIKHTMAELIGKPGYGLVRSHGSMFFLEIGKPRRRRGSKIEQGEWHFLIKMCSWRFDSEGAILVGSDDEQSLIDDNFSHLELGTIEAAEVFPPAHDLRIDFSSGMRFSTFWATGAVRDRETPWSLYCPDDCVWIVDEKGGLTLRDIDE